jgi:hypothetical protein
MAGDDQDRAASPGSQQRHASYPLGYMEPWRFPQRPTGLYSSQDELSGGRVPQAIASNAQDTARTTAICYRHDGAVPLRQRLGAIAMP